MAKGQVFLALIAFWTCNCVAQTALDLYDGDGTRLGTLVSVPDPDGAALHMATDDGYLVKFDAGSGLIRLRKYDGVPGLVWYKSTNCTGQSYIDFNDGLSNWLYPRGGEIFQLGYTWTAIFAKVEWATPYEEVQARSSNRPWTSDPCTPEEVVRDLVPISYIAPEEYGIKFFGLPERYGFNPPITARPRKTDGIFCSGFESCPASATD